MEHSDKGYAAKLLFDSFTKGKIANQTTVVGAATFVSFEGESAILLKEFSEPASGPFEHAMGRVFRLDLTSDTVTLVSLWGPPKKVGPVIRPDLAKKRAGRVAQAGAI